MKKNRPKKVGRRYDKKLLVISSLFLFIIPITAFAVTENVKITSSDAAELDAFGSSVSVSGDTAVVGSFQDDDGGTDSGSAYVFTKTAGVWTQQGKLTASDAAEGDNFGISVSVSGDTIVVGSRLDDDGGSNSGSAYVFTRTAGVWTQQAKLTAFDAAAFDQFGESVSVSGDTIVAGAYRDDDVFNGSGSAYVFTRTAGVWTQQGKLTASDPIAGASLGRSVSISGDTLVTGAHIDNSVGFHFGSAYVFTRTDGVWTQQAKLTAFDAFTSDTFGSSVSVSGDTAVVGSPGDDDEGSNSGSAYVFTRTDGVWTHQAKLTASDAVAEDLFGLSVSVSGDTAVVGSFQDDDVPPNSGSAYVFTRIATVWTQQGKLTASDAAPFDNFGKFVSVSGDTAAVGSSGDDDDGNGSGSAYIFEFVIPDADLSISKSDNTDPVNPGDVLTYTVTVDNAGPDTAENVVATETLPAGVIFVSTNGCNEDPNGVSTCSLGNIISGGFAQYTVTVTVKDDAVGTLTNLAQVNSDIDDSNSDNNSIMEETTIFVGSIEKFFNELVSIVQTFTIQVLKPISPEPFSQQVSILQNLLPPQVISALSPPPFSQQVSILQNLLPPQVISALTPPAFSQSVAINQSFTAEVMSEENTIEQLIENIETSNLSPGITNALLNPLQSIEIELTTLEFSATAQVTASSKSNTDNSNQQLKEACGKLDAFINKVNALSHKKIDSLDAVSFMGSAEAIKQNFGC